MPSEKPARRLRDILGNADSIARYTEGMDLGAFTADAKTRDAVERCLERISEAARKLDEQAPRLVGDQPWPQIAALGNRLRHHYDRIRADRLWEIVRNDLPSLRTACEQALARLRTDE